ncbi:MAG TPA: hypothetical protein VHM19_07575, partial [Polyangiales bacterium]|nr:hypothetical protein [Polyangiales bacterium]
ANSSGQAPGGIVDPVGMDWYTFGNRWRTWFLAGATLGKGGARGTCMTGTDPPMCSVWDWRAKAGSLLGNKLGPSPYYALRDASNVITHDWQAISQAECDEIAGAAWNGNACTSTFLAHSYEPVSDGVGNDNGLCEPDEACIFNPNYGAYPGEGALVDSEPDPIGGVHIDQFGAITLKEFSINGE